MHASHAYKTRTSFIFAKRSLEKGNEKYWCLVGASFIFAVPSQCQLGKCMQVVFVKHGQALFVPRRCQLGKCMQKS